MSMGWKATLLLSTCLAVAPLAEAGATSLFEAQDTFGDSFAGATPVTQLSPDFIEGYLDDTDTTDFLKWSGLGHGTYAFTLSGNASFLPLSSSNTVLPSGFTGNIPNDGIIVLRATNVSGFSETYRVTLSTRLAKVPEPASIALFGVGAAAAFGLKRRKRAKEAGSNSAN